MTAVRAAADIWWSQRAAAAGYASLSDFITAYGLEKYRLQQIYRAATKQLAEDVAALSVLPAPLRAQLGERLRFSSVSLKHEATSGDGQTTKLLLGLADGQEIEAVLMRHQRARTTACISSQAGCALRCDFCATGQGGFMRNLSALEIFDQALLLARRARAEGTALSNVVFMGMGEPFLNYDAVLSAVALLNDAAGFNLGARRITISTAGVVPAIRRFTQESSQVNLATSLHAADDVLRTKLMPINKRWPIAVLMDALHEYVRQTRRKVFYEYLMLAGVNDRPQDARQLADLLGGPLHHVNLIPYNPTAAPYGRSSPAAIRRFAAILRERNVPATLRHTMGDDIAAACGQLRVQRRAAVPALSAR